MKQKCMLIALGLVFNFGANRALAKNAPRLDTPAEAKGFSGTLTGTVTETEWNGKWANLKVSEAVASDPANSAAAKALAEKTLSVVVSWEQGPNGLKPKADEAAYLKGLKRGSEVTLEASVNKRGLMQLSRVPENAGSPTAAPAAVIKVSPPAKDREVPAKDREVPAEDREVPADSVRAPNPIRTGNGTEWGWVPVGGGGNMMMTAYHPQNPNLKVLRSDVAGLFIKDQPGQEVWRSMLLSSSLGLEDGEMRHPSAVAMHPTDDNTFYTSTQRGIYKTTDRADTWKLVHEVDMHINGNSKKRSEPMAIDLQNPEVVYAGTWDGLLLRSLNGGASWQQIKGIPTPDFGENQRDYGIPCVVVDASSPEVNGRSGTVYFGGFNIGIFRSTDGGDSFQRISDQLTHPHHMRLDSLGALYVSNDDKGLFRFENDSWSDTLLDRCIGFAIHPTDPDRIVAAGGNVMRSLDRGKTWTAWAGNDGNFLRRSSGWWREWGNKWGVPNSVSINPHNPDEALLVTVYTAYQSDDIWGEGLNVWDWVAQGVEMTVAFDMTAPPGLNAFFTTYGDVFALRHRSLTEYPGEEDVVIGGHVVPSIDYHAADSRQIWAARVGGWKYFGIHVLVTRDAGDSWTRLDSPFGRGKPMSMAHIAVSATNPDNVMIASVIEKEGNRYTLDGGKTWQVSKNLPGNLQGHNPSEYWFFGNILASDKVANRFYAYNYRTGDENQGKIWTSVDGAEWTVVADNLPSSKGREKAVGITTAYNKAGWLAVTSPWAKRAHLSQDAGKTWTRLAGFDDVWSVSYGMSRPGSDTPTLFVLGQKQSGEYGVYHSPDFFEADTPTWNFLNHPEVPLINPRNVVGCLQEYGRAFVSDAGRSWLYVRQPGLAK